MSVCLCACIQLFVIRHATPSFASVGRMIVNVKLSIPDANVYSEELNNFYGTQVELMQCDSVITRVNQVLQSTNSEMRRMPVKLTVTISQKTSIFNLKAIGGDPLYTQAYLAEIMEEYIKLKKDLLSNATISTELGIKEELKQKAVALQKSKDEILDYQSSNSVVFLQPEGGNSAADYLSSLTRQLAERKSELMLLETLTLDQNAERQQLQSSMSRTNTYFQQTSEEMERSNYISQNVMPSDLGEFERDYLKAKQQLIVLQAKQNELSNTLSSTAPEMINANQEVMHQQSLVNVLADQSQERLKNRDFTLNVQIRDLQGQIKEWELKAVDVNTKLSKFEALKENQRRLQTIYDQIEANLQTLEVNKGIGQESVTILEPATQAMRIQPEIPKHLIVAGSVGLVLGIAMVMLIYKLDDRINSFAELKQHFKLPILGQIPIIQTNGKGAGTPILQLEDNRYPLVEAFRNLRSALLYKDFLKGGNNFRPKSIVISSASPHDGKSLTAANFGITLAQAGARVLLIDADLRRGVLHKHFSISISPGLAEVLAEQCVWSEAVVQTTMRNLHIMPCGTQPRNAVHLFAMAGKVLAEMAGHYDYYVFDTSPVMVADDVLSLAPHTDGLIMVIRAGFTPIRITQVALELLRLRQVNVIGLLFNAVHPDAGDYYFHRFKQYYPKEQSTALSG